MKWTDRYRASTRRMHLLGIIALVSLSSVARADDVQQRVKLPKAGFDGEMSVESAIKKRRSVREFSRADLAIADLAQLLWAAQGITGRDGLRSAPSAGALYPLELYVAAGEVNGLAPGVYRYRPRQHDLMLVASGDPRKALAAAAADQSWVHRAPATLVFTGVYERTMKKYDERGRRYVRMEVGHAAQNVYLQATSRGLSTVMVGAFYDREVQTALDLPADHEPLGLMPVGYER